MADTNRISTALKISDWADDAAETPTVSPEPETEPEPEPETEPEPEFAPVPPTLSPLLSPPSGCSPSELEAPGWVSGELAGAFPFASPGTLEGAGPGTLGFPASPGAEMSCSDPLAPWGFPEEACPVAVAAAVSGTVRV